MLPPEENVSAITMQEFLDFLKITCQVNESIGGNHNKNAAQIDYSKLSKNELVNGLLVRIAPQNKSLIEPSHESVYDAEGYDSEYQKNSTHFDKTRTKISKSRYFNTSKHQQSKLETEGDSSSQLHPILNEKLHKVINEGILDSVLPFICFINNTSATANAPQKVFKQQQRIQTQQIFDFKPPQVNNEMPAETTSLPKKCLQANETISITNNLASMSSREKIRGKSIIPMAENRSEYDVIIHVCDEVKGLSRDFTCPQKLLVTKMGYFADVTMGSKQRLEDMDISVHCDLLIFEWLMKWVKRESLSSDDQPLLEPSNVIPVLVSASFLQMEPLLIDCLSFCHARLNEIVKSSSNLSCLNDGIITRLAAMFTNLELEMVRDKKDRVAPRLWTKLIQSLCEPETQSLRGHYASLAGLFRCTRCGKLLTPAVCSYVNCFPQNMKINRWGQLVSQHSRDTNWNITNFVVQLYNELKAWRKVYWRLWGHCHFLYCAVCETHFPTYQMLWCQFHVDQPQFLGPVSEGRTPGPGGRYPCCNQPAFRYETVSGPTGCEEREHTVQIENERDRAIFHLSQVAAEGGCLFDVPPSKSNNSSLEPWWTGIAVLPYRSRLGLLPCFHVDECYGNLRTISSKAITTRQNSIMFESSSDSDDSSVEKDTLLRRFSSSSDGCESDENSPKRYGKLSAGRYWSGDMSARSNQDNQREFEERAIKQVTALVSKKTGSESSTNYQNYQQGGTYIRLENEWRDNFKHKNSTIKNKNLQKDK